MNQYTIQVALQVTFLLIIVLLAFRTISLILEVRTSNKFKLKGFLQKEERKKFQSTSDITFLERMTSFKKYKTYLEQQLIEAKMDTDVIKLIIKRFILAFLFLMLGIVLFYITHLKLYLYLAIPLGFIAYKLPKRTIKKNRTYYERQMKIELPEYLSAFAMLLQSYAPFEATRKSLDYAGTLLKPHVEHLITQIELYPASSRPYEEFAESVDIREAREFIVALNQIIRVDGNAADNIISDQIKIMDELEEEAYNEQIETVPDEVDKYVTPMLFPLVAIIMTFLFILISDTFSKI